jgi:2-polyprenyl-3-methyl-5-hydroxy-6-metoxy-1,4-benzoquinol methylase
MKCPPINLLEIFTDKYGPLERLGRGPRARLRFRYFNPDDIYEATLSSLINTKTNWLDVGCGRQIFPYNLRTATVLAQRCRLLVGVDPSDNIDGNELVHERYKGLIEDYHTDRQFDLITIRMVAEHITSPSAAVSAFSRLIKPGGRVVVYTVFRWSPVTVLSGATPMYLHYFLKRLFWGAEERDTFPVAYLMNTRKKLKTVFQSGGFQEEQFSYLDDCRTLGRWKLTLMAELCVWRLLNSLGLHYPEVCILGIYRRHT